jgi:hypothetical protein
MTTQTIRTAAAVGGALLAMIALGACGSSDDDRDPARYTITLTNLTADQPLAPAAAILHDGGYAAWRVGRPATAGLELLAESGDPADLAAEAEADASVRASATGSGVLAPGQSSALTLEGVAGEPTRLEMAAMLVNTNDAFAGASALDLGNLQVGEGLTATLAPYDAGTEPNTETAATVPGPAGGGEGFSAAGGEGFVAVHPGVVTAADGLAGSALGESHRFQSPVARLQVVRTR